MRVAGTCDQRQTARGTATHGGSTQNPQSTHYTHTHTHTTATSTPSPPERGAGAAVQDLLRAHPRLQAPLPGGCHAILRAVASGQAQDWGQRGERSTGPCQAGCTPVGNGRGGGGGGRAAAGRRGRAGGGNALTRAGAVLLQGTQQRGAGGVDGWADAAAAARADPKHAAPPGRGPACAAPDFGGRPGPGAAVGHQVRHPGGRGAAAVTHAGDAIQGETVL